MHLIGAAAKIIFRKLVLMCYFGATPPSVLSSFKRKAEALRQAFIGNKAFHFADYILTNSNYTFRLLPKAVRQKALVNPHGIEHLISKNQEKAALLRERLGVKNKLLILSVGRFQTPYKGMREVTKIFIRLKKVLHNVALLLVGRGDPKHLGVDPSKDLHVMPNVSYETLKNCFAACDIYCTASKWEGFNIPVVAAQANGKPVVAYNVGAHPEVILDRKTGFLVENAIQFEECLSLLVKDSELRRNMGREAAKHAKKFTWDSNIDKMEKIINILREHYGL